MKDGDEEDHTAGARTGACVSRGVLRQSGVPLRGGAFIDLHVSRPEQTTNSPSGVPEVEALKLTIPKMDRVKNLPDRRGPATHKDALGESALHVRNTGFPWQENANVYIASHRLGYPGSDSFLVFYDLDTLEQSDEVFLNDATSGTRYTYRVLKSFVVGPYDSYVTEPVPGKSVVSLQTCTLPNFADRLVVHAELEKVQQS